MQNLSALILLRQVLELITVSTSVLDRQFLIADRLLP